MTETYQCEECGKHYVDKRGRDWDEYEPAQPPSPAIKFICYSCKVAAAIAAAAGMTAAVVMVLR